jgi:oligoendopeptidase F
VDPEAVEALEAAVLDAYPRLSHRYYALKAKALGKSSLDYWDRNAPLTEAPPRRFDWTEARSLVLDSFSELSPRFAEAAQAFLDKP